MEAEQLVDQFRAATGDSVLAWVEVRRTLTDGVLLATPSKLVFASLDFMKVFQMESWPRRAIDQTVTKKSAPIRSSFRDVFRVEEES